MQNAKINILYNRLESICKIVVGNINIVYKYIFGK